MKLWNLAYSRFIARAPFYIVFHVTSRCNAGCFFCFNWRNIQRGGDRRELTLNEINEMTKKIGRFHQLTISGGEPFLRDDLAEIAKMFHRRCFVQQLTIPTNGMLTRRIGRTLKKIVEENKNLHVRLVLSLSEIGERLSTLYKIDNAFYKHKESFRIARNLMEKFENLSISTNVVCNKYNSERVPEILDYIREEMKESKAYLTLVRGNPFREDSKEVEVKEIEKNFAVYKKKVRGKDNLPLGGIVNTMTDMVNEITMKTLSEKKAQLPCRCGEKLIVIYDNGDVYPCEYLIDKKLGNVRDYDYDIVTMLQRPSVKSIVREIIEKKCCCTWECANYNNIIFSIKYLGKLMLRRCGY